jgi:hypothetical protein
LADIGKQLEAQTKELQATFKSLGDLGDDEGEGYDGRDVLLDNPRTEPIVNQAGSGQRPYRSLPPTAPAKAMSSALTSRRNTADPPQEDPLDELAKALFDALADVMPDVARKVLNEVLPDARDLEGRVALRVGQHLESEVAGLEDAVVRRFEHALEATRQKHALAMLEQAHAHAREISSLRELLADLLGRLPAPVVNVQPSVINVPQQEAPMVYVPPDAIRVTAHAPPPRKTTTTKSIVYDPESGRPAEIREVTREEE